MFHTYNIFFFENVLIIFCIINVFPFSVWFLWPFFFTVVLSLSFVSNGFHPNLLVTKRFGCYCCCCNFAVEKWIMVSVVRSLLTLMKNLKRNSRCCQYKKLFLKHCIVKSKVPYKQINLVFCFQLCKHPTTVYCCCLCICFRKEVY
jgi:hypothetical protein